MINIDKIKNLTDEEKEVLKKIGTEVNPKGNTGKPPIKITEEDRGLSSTSFVVRAGRKLGGQRLRIGNRIRKIGGEQDTLL